MKLEIRDSSGLLKPEFGKWLAKRAYYHISKQIDDKKCARFDNYFNSNKNVLFPLIGNKTKVSTHDIILLGGKNLILQTTDPITVEIDHKITTPNFDRASLNTLCKFINYGNTQILGYPIFTDVFQELVDNIDELVDEYYSTLPHFDI